MNSKLKVCAVLVTYNRVDLLERAVNALLGQTYQLDSLVIVNNNSTDNTANYLNEIASDSIHVVHLNSNTGGAGGFSVGINYGYSLSTDFIWIMDDDAVPDKDALLGLINAEDRLSIDNIKTGFLCSHVVSDDNQCMNVPGVSSKKNDTGYLDWPAYASEGIIAVDKATFVSVLFRREVIADVGLPVKEMFIWGDDTEFTWRISKNYKCFYVANSVVVHKRVSAQSLSLPLETNINRISWYKFLYRNSLYNARKHGGLKDYISYAKFFIIDFCQIIIKSKGFKLKKMQAL
ncbi:glycosyltransferase family 2 protein, partial [Pluralibacter gergoviae]|nr:glycosyltransferase family 2 protein [Pluralibacter gergoviae]